MGFIKFNLPSLPPFIRAFIEPVITMKETRHMIAFGVFAVLAVSAYINLTSKRLYTWYEKLFLIIALMFILTLSATFIVMM